MDNLPLPDGSSSIRDYTPIFNEKVDLQSTNSLFRQLPASSCWHLSITVQKSFNLQRNSDDKLMILWSPQQNALDSMSLFNARRTMQSGIRLVMASDWPRVPEQGRFITLYQSKALYCISQRLKWHSSNPNRIKEICWFSACTHSKGNIWKSIFDPSSPNSVVSSLMAMLVLRMDDFMCRRLTLEVCLSFNKLLGLVSHGRPALGAIRSGLRDQVLFLIELLEELQVSRELESSQKCWYC